MNFNFEEINLYNTNDKPSAKFHNIKYSQKIKSCIFALIVNDELAYYTKTREKGLKYIKSQIDNYKTSSEVNYVYKKEFNEKLGYGEISLYYKDGFKIKQIITYKLIVLPEIIFE